MKNLTEKEWDVLCEMAEFYDQAIEYVADNEGEKEAERLRATVDSLWNKLAQLAPEKVS